MCKHNYPALQQSLRVGARGNTAALLVATTPTPDPALTATVTTPVPLPVAPIGATNASAAFNDQAPQAAALKVPFLPPSLPPALSAAENKKRASKQQKNVKLSGGEDSGKKLEIKQAADSEKRKQRRLKKRKRDEAASGGSGAGTGGDDNEL